MKFSQAHTELQNVIQKRISLQSPQGSPEQLPEKSPATVGPFRVYLTVQDPLDEEVMQSAEILYREMKARGLSPLFDDRLSESSSASENDQVQRLLNIPSRVCISSSGLSSGRVELTYLTAKKLQVPLEDAVDKVVESLNEGRAN